MPTGAINYESKRYTFNTYWCDFMPPYASREA